MTVSSTSAAEGNGHPERHALSERLLDVITALQSPHGFVSVYAGIDRGDPDRVRIELKSACARIEAEHTRDETREQLSVVLRSITAAVHDALVGRTKAIAGFVAIGSQPADAIWVELPEVASTTVIVDPCPYALPLLAMIEQFSVSGVVTVARDQIAVYEWAHGGLEQRKRQSVDVDTSAWRDSDGPFNAGAVGGSPRGGSGAQSTIGSDDAYAEKLDAAIVDKLARVAAPLIDRHVDEGGWKQLMWFGDAAIVDAVRGAMGAARVTHVAGDDVQVLGVSREQLVERVREVTEQRWAQDGSATLRSLAERRPADRVENVQEARTLAREGRVADLYVTVAEEYVVDDDRREINSLIGEVARHGGRVRALPGERSGDDPGTGIVATLRW